MLRYQQDKYLNFINNYTLSCPRVRIAVITDFYNNILCCGINKSIFY